MLCSRHKRTKKVHKTLQEDILSQKQESITHLKELIELKIQELFNINKIEQDLINYVHEVSIPVMKRADRKNHLPISIFDEITKESIENLENYCDIFFNHFGERFENIGKEFLSDVYINKNFVAINFKVLEEKRDKKILYHFNSKLSEAITKIGGLGIQNVSTNLFTQQDIRGFNKNSFYVIKPNIKKNWHKAIAHIDLSEFIESITKSELKNRKV